MSTSLRAGDFRAVEGDDGLFSMVFNPAGTTTTPVVNNTPTVTVDPAKAAFDAATSDITNLYQTLLRRSPDKPGLDWWASTVSSGNATLQDVANQFRNSAEYKVVTAYNDVLGRYPEQAGLDWWVKQATDQNLTVDQLKNELSKTPELISKQLAPLQAQWDAEVANQEQPGIQTDIKVGQIQFGGNEWDAYRTPNGNLIIQKLNADQTGVGKGQYKGDFLNPTTGEVTTQIVDRSKMPTYGKVIMGGLLALAAANPSLFDLTGAAAGTLAPETLATLQTVGQAAIPEIVSTTGGLLDAGLAAGAAAGAGVTDASFIAADAAQLAGQGLSQSQITQVLEASGVDSFIAADAASLANQGLNASQITDLINQSGKDLNLFNPTTTVSTTPTTTTTTTTGTTAAGTGTTATTAGTAATGAAGSAAGSAAGNAAGTLSTESLFSNLGTSLTKGFTDAVGTLLTGLTSGNASNAVGNLITAGVNYQQAKEAADALLAAGQLSQQQYNNLAANIQGQYNQLATTTGQQLGEFTPYGVTTNLFGQGGQAIQNAAMQAAQQSFNQAGLTNVDQLSQDYYNKLSALSAPDIARQRLATEERLRAQGRLGVSGAAYGGSSPELLAQEQAIAQQQLQRELASRQAALGERGTLLSQGAAVLAPATSLATTAQQAAQQEFAANLARQNLLTGMQSKGIEASGTLQRQGISDMLARQLAATAARSGANQQLTQSLFGGAGGTASSGGSSLFGSILNNIAQGQNPLLNIPVSELWT